jgi:hypothetical protein
LALLSLSLPFLSALRFGPPRFARPSIDRLPIPGALVAADTPAGQELLSEKRFISDYDGLMRNFELQSRRAFCGVASSVVVLNALRTSAPRLTQSTFFTDATNKVRTSLQITFGGMTLAELGELLQAHGAHVTVYYASDSGLDAFRSVAQQNLATAGDFLLVNYQRAALGQGEIGHISPIAAYNVKTDRLLILDVASYKYPPVWVSTEVLWKAMNTVDPASGRTRGFATVTEGWER